VRTARSPQRVCPPQNNINIEEAFYTIARDVQARLQAVAQVPGAGVAPMRLQSGGGQAPQKGGCC
jgi:hypothetical protein